MADLDDGVLRICRAAEHHHSSRNDRVQSDLHAKPPDGIFKKRE
jgi:hypothetical protein